ncbi:MAG TPA: arylmalonate decarboxylase [Mycobacteriales bacterium]|nr:arylmalonate decarboxylase [Mycobacteriales bacterium]
MTNVVGPRATFGVIVPSTNTVVESEYYQMRPDGVSFHAGRIWISDEGLGNDEDFERFLVHLRAQLAIAVRDVLTCRPDYLVMGMSAETFWGGADGNEKFESWIRELSGLRVSTGASACRAALGRYGAKRIGVITPYQPVGDEQVRRFFTDLGFTVTGVRGLKCPTATSIAEVGPDTVAEAFRAVDGPGVDALVQAGTNLCAARVAADLEQSLGKPVIAINTATVWHALRGNGIDDRFDGFGALLAEH